MPACRFRGRPLRTTGPILLPRTSLATRSESIRFGSGFAAEALAAMTKRTILAKQGLAVLHHRGRGAVLTGLVCAVTNAQLASKATLMGTIVLNLNSLNLKS